MHLVPRWADRNLSRLEVIVAWILILILIGTFARYMFVLFAEVERSMVNRTVSNIETALKYRAGMARLKGETAKIKQMQTDNPIGQIASPHQLYSAIDDDDDIEQSLAELPNLPGPANYGGEIADSDLDSVKKGNWYYNVSDGTLIYIIRNEEFFVSDLGGIARLRYKVTLDFVDKNGNGEYDPEIDSYRSIALSPRDVYEWVD